MAAPAAPPPPVRFPIGWLLEHASPSIQYRSIVEVARLPVPEHLVRVLPLAQRSAIALSLSQQIDGTWNDAMLTVPGERAKGFEGIGTITAVRRLLEYGWDRDTPPIHLARRTLFRLLAEDESPDYLFELGETAGSDPAMARRGRGILREAAAAALAQAGYEGDPRLRGAARRILGRISTWLRSPGAAKPFVRVGNQHVLPEEAAPPSIHALVMLAHMPLFRTEHHDDVDMIHRWITQPQPRQESVQLCGKSIVAQPHLVLGDQLPHRNAADADVPSAIMWLEIMARLGFLKKNEGWCRLFDRFLEDRDAQGVWHPHKGSAVARTTSPFAWPTYPLEDGQHAGDERWTDITFRLGLIARLAGRTIELV